MFGLPRSGDGDYDPSSPFSDPFRDGTIGSRLDKLVSRLPSKVAEYAYNAFLADHRNRLPNDTIPWFIPEAFGGMGLRPLFGRKADLRDIESASMIQCCPELFKPFRLFGSAPGSNEICSFQRRWMRSVGLRSSHSFDPEISLSQALFARGIWTTTPELEWYADLTACDQTKITRDRFIQLMKIGRENWRLIHREWSHISAYRALGLVSSLSSEHSEFLLWASPPREETFLFQYQMSETMDINELVRGFSL